MENMKILRQDKGLTQREMAKELNLAKATYARYEIGESEPSIEVLIKIADFFDVSLDYLCGRQNPNLIYADGLSQIKKDLIKKVTQVDDRIAERTESYMNGLIVAENDKEDIINRLKRI